MKIGIRAHDINMAPLKDLAFDIKKNNFEYVQLVPFKGISDYHDPDYFLNKEEAIRIEKGLKEQNIKVAMLGAYFNPVHSNKQVVTKGISKFKNYLAFANEIGTKYVGSETGSYNDDEWTYNPKNRTEEAYKRVLNVFSDLAHYAEEHKSSIAIEGAYGHVIHSPQMMKRLVDDINSPDVFVTIDLFNYLDISNYQKQKEIFDEAIHLLKEKIVIFHLKDFIVQGEGLIEVALGSGLIDYEYIIPNIKKHCPNAYLIFEGITGDNINKSKIFINNLI